MLMFSLLLLCVVWDYSNSKQKAKQYTENLTAKLQTEIKILAYAGLSWSGFEQPGPGTPFLGLAKSVY